MRAWKGNTGEKSKKNAPRLRRRSLEAVLPALAPATRLLGLPRRGPRGFAALGVSAWEADLFLRLNLRVGFREAERNSHKLKGGPPF